MGGAITAKSRKGVGSAFTVELPMELVDAEQMEEKHIPVDRADLSGVHVLMAEDNELNAEIALVQLQELGIRATRASDGREAVRLFAENPPDTFDMILMDIMMPGLNGY